MTPGVPAPVAIAVVSWNTRDLLERCLRSMEPEVRAGRAEVWVVDNASDDGSADLVGTRFGWAHLIASATNLGFGAAVNLVGARTDSACADHAVERYLIAGTLPGKGAVCAQDSTPF